MLDLIAVSPRRHGGMKTDIGDLFEIANQLSILFLSSLQFQGSLPTEEMVSSSSDRAASVTAVRMTKMAKTVRIPRPTRPPTSRPSTTAPRRPAAAAAGSR